MFRNFHLQYGISHCGEFLVLFFTLGLIIVYMAITSHYFSYLSEYGYFVEVIREKTQFLVSSYDETDRSCVILRNKGNQKGQYLVNTAVGVGQCSK